MASIKLLVTLIDRYASHLPSTIPTSLARVVNTLLHSDESVLTQIYAAAVGQPPTDKYVKLLCSGITVLLRA
jgi:hypothetical protein